MQWTQRNVPVYLRRQQQADERALEKLLFLKQQERDEQYMEEEQVEARVHFNCHKATFTSINLIFSQR